MISTIYRGTREIGGTLIELRSARTRLLLDAGYPLLLGGSPVDADTAALPKEQLLALGFLPPIAGLYHWDTPSFDAVLISHAHIDHYGLLKFIHPDIPVYLSAGTRALIEVSQLFKVCAHYPINARPFAMQAPFTIGDFRVTPYLMDHSAFDAAAFEMTAEGKTVIYSGDFRGHGRKPACLDRFIRCACGHADVLFIEGTMISRGEEQTLTEAALENAATHALDGKGGIALVQLSSQNIDRLVSFYRAALRLGRMFVVDIYTANVLQTLHALGSKIPYPSYDRLRVFFPYRLTQRVFEEIGEEYARKFSGYRISREDIQAQQNEIIMLARPSMQKDLERCNLAGGHFFYSMWQGYRDSAYQQAFEGWMDEKGFCKAFLHTSGHATVSDIRRLIDGLCPKRIIPIHTLQPSAFLDYSEKTALQMDGVSFSI